MARKTQDEAATNPDATSGFERFEDLVRRIVNVPREEVLPPKRTPRTSPATTHVSPKSR